MCGENRYINLFEETLELNTVRKVFRFKKALKKREKNKVVPRLFVL